MFAPGVWPSPWNSPPVLGAVVAGVFDAPPKRPPVGCVDPPEGVVVPLPPAFPVPNRPPDGFAPPNRLPVVGVAFDVPPKRPPVVGAVVVVVPAAGPKEKPVLVPPAVVELGLLAPNEPPDVPLPVFPPLVPPNRLDPPPPNRVLVVGACGVVDVVAGGFPNVRPLPELLVLFPPPNRPPPVPPLFCPGADMVDEADNFVELRMRCQRSELR